MQDDSLSAETYAGYKRGADARAFVCEGLRREGIHVTDTWDTEHHCYFRLCADDGHRYVVRYEFEKARWELVMREQ